GIPSKTRILRDGDLINIDVSAELNGYYGDNGSSFILGKDIKGLSPLVEASREILYKAIEQISDNVRIADVGGLIEQEAKLRGYHVIKNICGHGIGRKLHEEPREIPCFRDRNNQIRFKNNTVVALETFISTGAQYVDVLPDGWTMVAQDDSYVTQHEHTLIVTNGKPIIVTKANGI
ncbi:MAG: type I methionyl aminopeptidase, partial [Bacteroidota bacterium]